MKKIPEPKSLFVERMKKIFSDEKDLKEYFDILKILPVKSIRCNKLKISPSELKRNLENNYGWKIVHPWKSYPEVMIVESDLEPGELGRSMEHLLGYYYIQELASMLPIIALSPSRGERVLDLCSAPGSKTTQMAAEMENAGLIVANEVSNGRAKILAANLERCGVSNVVITKNEGISLCKKFRKESWEFDKILVDAPCSGEGTLRSSWKTYHMWNENTIKKLSKIQKNLFKSAFEILKNGGEIIYSTCTHAPEENEAVVDFMLKEFSGEIEIERIKLPVICRPGMREWDGEEFSSEVKNCCRVYPQDSDTEGFFVSKFRRVK